jgi:HTH-type transcriptional repressor of NAD biosynthesis genes
MGKEHDLVGWASGGSWNDDTGITYDPPPTPVKPGPTHEQEVARVFGPEAPPGTQTGFVCGRFSPPHRGHEYLLQIARQSCATLVVLVFGAPGDAVPVARRIQWLQQIFPGLDARDGGPRPDPASPDFARTWRELIEKHVPGTPRFMYTSEPDAEPLAAAANATCVIVDPERNAIPCSSTVIREDPLRQFELLSVPVRPVVVRRIAVVGAESTGKSTLAARLAWDHYGTLFVPEVARTFAERRGGDLHAEDLQLVARTQMACEDALVRHAHRFLFCDTELVSLRAWSERLWGLCPSWIPHESAQRPYDLYLVSAPDVPYVGAPARDKPAERQAFHARLLALLGEQKANVTVLSGSWEDRLDAARNAVDKLLGDTKLLSARGPWLLR